MKKILVLLAALLITVSLAGCGGNEEPAADKQETPKQEAATAPEAELLSKPLVDMMKSGKFMVRYDIDYVQDGASINFEIAAAIDGETVDCIMKNEEGLTIHSLITEDALYFIDDANKTYAQIPMMAEEEPAAELDTLVDEAFSYTGSGVGTVEGKTLPYEEYAAGAETLRYYFDGKQLYAIVVSDAEGETVMRILELTAKIPAGMLRIPAGYTEAEGAVGGAPGDLGLSEEELQELKALQQ